MQITTTAKITARDLSEVQRVALQLERQQLTADRSPSCLSGAVDFIVGAQPAELAQLVAALS